MRRAAAMREGAAGSAPVRPRDNPFAARHVDALTWRSPGLGLGCDPRDGGPRVGGGLPGPGRGGGDPIGGPDGGAPDGGAPEPLLDHLLDRLEALGGRGAVVGPEGHGKSTLLDALERRLARRGLTPRRLAVHPDRPLPAGALGRFLRGAGGRDALLVDGAGHLSPWSWWRVRRAARPAAGLVIAVHRPGRLPTLHRCETTPELLRELVDELLAGAPPPVPLPTAEELHARHRGDLRLALGELYDRCAGRRNTPLPAPLPEARGAARRRADPPSPEGKT